MTEIYEIGPLLLDAGSHLLIREGKPVALGQRAVRVLTALVRSEGTCVTKSQILEAAWPGMVVEENNLTVQMVAIRRVLAQIPMGETWIETLTARGYRFVGPVTRKVPARAPDRPARLIQSNLPLELSSFIGREREIAQIQSLLSAHRLVTLSGAGGVGKTRLALRVAAAVMHTYPDGVWLVELATLAEPTLVPQTVAATLGIKEQPGRSLNQTLVEHLRPVSLLLLLDNAEHLRDACGQLVDLLLRHCARLVVLVTSREPLAISGESAYRVPSLSTPAVDCAVTAQSAASYESVRLFQDRARIQRPLFALTDEIAPAVTSICQHLDGIALAIELAAARIRSMSVQEVNQRLDQRFRLLTGGSRSAPRRHQTLRATIDWSFDLLSQAEMSLLNRLSVFAGGWTLETAEKVCAAEGIECWEVLDLLTALADKCLVVAEERSGATRYGFLESVRAYARERLEEGGNVARWLDRHLAGYLELAQLAAPELRGTDQQVWLERLEMEHDNLRAALAHGTARSAEPAAGLELASALWRFWYVRGHLAEGRRWLSVVLEDTRNAPLVQARATAFYGAGSLAWLQGEFETASDLHESALVLRRGLSDRQGIASSLNSLGLVARDQGNLMAARGYYEESLSIWHEIRDKRGVGVAANNLGLLAKDEGDYERARALLGRSLALARELGDRSGAYIALGNLGNIAVEQGHLDSAQALYEEGQAMASEMGDRLNIAAALNNLGDLSCRRGDHEAALEMHVRCLRIRRELGARQGIAESLEGLAGIVLAKGGPAAASRIWGAAQRLREEVGSPLPPGRLKRVESQVEAARSALADDAVFDRLWREGRSMTLAEALEYAVESAR